MARGRGIRRRRYLEGALVGLIGLAGCSSRDSTSTRTQSATATSTRPSTATASSTATETETETTTAESSVTEFDGGGSAAFAAALDELADTPGGTLRVAPGTYRLDASEAPSYEFPRDDDRVHFDASGLVDATIAGPPPDAGTATFVLTDPTRGFVLLRDARDSVVRDLTVTYDPLPHTQAVIRSLAADGRTMTVDVADGFPALHEPPFRADHDPDVVWANVFESDGRRVRRVTSGERGNFKRIESVERVGSRRFRLTLAEGIEAGALATGRRLAVMAWHGNASAFNHADCVAPTYERVTLRASPYRGFNFNATRRPVVRESVVAPATESGRLVSTNADPLHCNNCPVGPRIVGNRFERGCDDTVAVDNELMAVRGFRDDATVEVVVGFGTRVGAGDVLTAATERLERMGSLPPVAAVDKQGGPTVTEPSLPEAITFERSVRSKLSTGDVLTGPRMRNGDTVVRDNVVRSTRARYVRFGGVDGAVVADNAFAGTNSDGIEIEARANNGPGVSDLKGWSTDVVVRDNTIADTGLVGVPSGLPTGVFVGVDAGEGIATESAVSGRPHRNVTIRGNDIDTTAALGVELDDVQGGTVTDNDITEPGRIPVIDLGAHGVGFQNVADVTVRGNRVAVADDDLEAFGWRRESDGLELGTNAYVVAGSEEPATLTRIGP
jgi:hypothetical protein